MSEEPQSQPQLPPLYPEHSASEGEKSLACAAHLSALFALLMPWFGLLFLFLPAALSLLLCAMRPRSRHVRFHCAQAAAYQVLAACPVLCLWLAGQFLKVLVVGYLFLFAALCLGGAAVLYGAYGGVQALLAKRFRYPVVADIVETALGEM